MGIPRKGLPTFLVRVKYSIESFTAKEINKGTKPFTITMMFYDTSTPEEISARLKAAWREGATIEAYSMSYQKMEEKQFFKTGKWQ